MSFASFLTKSGKVAGGLTGKAVRKAPSGLAKFEAIRAPFAAVNNPRFWGGEDVPLSEVAAPAESFIGGLAGGTTRDRMGDVVEGNYQEYIDSSPSEILFGTDPVEAGGLMGAYELGKRAYGTALQGASGIWHGINQGYRYGMGGDPSNIGITQAEEDKLSAGQRALRGLMRPFTILQDLDNWRVAGEGAVLEPYGFRETDLAGYVSANARQRQEHGEMFTPERIQQLVDQAALPVDEQERETASRLMRDPRFKAAVKALAEERNVSPDTLLDPKVSKFFPTKDRPADIAATVGEFGSGIAGDYTDEIATPLRRGEYAAMSIDPNTGLPLRMMAGRSGEQITPERAKELLVGTNRTPEGVGLSPEARRQYAAREQVAREAITNDTNYRKVLGDLSQGMEGFDPKTGEVVVSYDMLAGLPLQDMYQVLRNWEQYNKKAPEGEKIQLRPRTAPQEEEEGEETSQQRRGGVGQPEEDPRTVGERARQQAMNSLSNQDKLILLRGENSNDTANKKRAKEIRDRIDAAGKEAQTAARRRINRRKRQEDLAAKQEQELNVARIENPVKTENELVKGRTPEQVGRDTQINQLLKLSGSLEEGNPIKENVDALLKEMLVDSQTPRTGGIGKE